MIQTRAVIIRLQGKDALVESTQGGGCGNCDSENGCSSGKLSQLFCSKPRRFLVRNDAGAAVGTLVDIAVPDGVLLYSALLMYLLPLVLLIFGAMAAVHWSHDVASNDTYSAIGGLIGLISGFMLVKFISVRRRLSSIALPVIL